MMKSFLFRMLALALVIAVPSLATVAVTHAHSSATSPHDSHCRLCLMAHSGTHALASSTVRPGFVRSKTGLLRHPNITPLVSPRDGVNIRRFHYPCASPKFCPV
jgi:hypothetical protein